MLSREEEYTLISGPNNNEKIMFQTGIKCRRVLVAFILVISFTEEPKDSGS